MMNMRQATVRALLRWGLAAALAACMAAGAFAAPVRVAFSRENSIYIMDLDGGEPLLLAEGYDPEISPDGSMVAFTAYIGGPDGGDRRIAVVDTDTKKVTVIDNIPGDNSYGPRWSPDGSQLLFNHWDPEGDDWVLATARPDRTGFRVPVPGLKGVYSPFWSADGKYAYCQNLVTLFRIDVAAGTVVDERPLENVTGEVALMSSAVRFSVSPDGGLWLFDAEVEDTAGLMKQDEPLSSAVFLHTTADGETIRLTPEDVCAMQPEWLPGGEFLYTAYEPDKPGGGRNEDYPFSVYRAPLDGGTPVLLAEVADRPSASR